MLDVVRGVGWRQVDLEFGMAGVVRLEGVEELADSVDRLGDGTGWVECRGGEIAVGADEVVVVAPEAEDGVVGLGGSSGRRSGTREYESGDAQGGEGGAGAEGIEAKGEDAVEDLGGHEHDGGAVVEERD